MSNIKTNNHLVSKSSSKSKLISAVIFSSICGLGLSYILPLIAKDTFTAFAQNTVPSNSPTGAITTPNNIPATNIPATTIPPNNIPATNIPAATVPPITVPAITPRNSTNDPNNTGVNNSVNTTTTTSPANSNVTNTTAPTVVKVVNPPASTTTNNSSNRVALNSALGNSAQNNRVNIQRTTPLFNPPPGESLSAYPQTMPLLTVPLNAPDCYIQRSDGRVLSLEKLCQP